MTPTREIVRLKTLAATLEELLSVTERAVEEQTELLVSEKRSLSFQKLLLEAQDEACADGILAFDDERVVSFNSALLEVFDLPRTLLQMGGLQEVIQRIAGSMEDPRTFLARAWIRHSRERTPFSTIGLKDGRTLRWRAAAISDAGRFLGRVLYFSDVTALVDAERRAIKSDERTRAIIDSAHDAIVTMDTELRIGRWNPATTQLLDWSDGPVAGRDFLELAVAPEQRAVFQRHASDATASLVLFDGGTQPWFDIGLRSRSGKAISAQCSIAATAHGDEACLTAFLRDVTDAQRLELELRQSQKLESVGRIAAGVAHELNTPIQFVGDSVRFARDALRPAWHVLERYRAAARKTTDLALLAELDRLEEEADLGYVLENVPRALERAVDGLSRMADIVRAMKEFAHPDQKEKKQVDLNHAIESTLTIARNEYKYVADLSTELAPDLPPVACHVGGINQVVLNIVVNAAHAIAGVVQGDQKGRILVSTKRDGDHVVIAIQDTGGGIPEKVRDHIFEPFFTTKEVGKGTGQGLAIARAVVVEKHQGTLTFATEVGRGTTFFIRLPLADRARASTRLSPSSAGEGGDP